MSERYRDITRSISAPLTQLRGNQPELMKGFTALSDAALRDGFSPREPRS